MHGRAAVLTAVVMVAGLFINPASGVAQPGQSRGEYTDVRALPDGPAGTRITELIELINAHDPEKVRAYAGEHFTPSFRDFAPMEVHVSTFMRLYEGSHGFEFYSVRKYTEPTPENEFVVINRNKLTGGWDAFIMQLEEKPPYRIAGLRFAPARPPRDVPPAGKLTDAEIVKELEAHLERVVEADAFSGTVLLAKDDKILFKGAYGLASKRFDAPNRVDTKFNLGSMNKMFTAVAIAQLAQRGKLSFDDPIGKYLSSDWLEGDVTDEVTIRHLLTHTSGLGSYFNATFMDSSRALYRAVEDYKPLVAGDRPAFEPGTQWSYSNTGFLLLGAILERVTGRSYFDYVGDNIYKPAGMVNTDCYEMDKPVPNLAIGYSRETTEKGPEWTNNLFKHVVKGGPAGGGFSTVEDLFRFATALRSHRLLSREYTELVLSAKPEANSPDYGYGFTVRGAAGKRVVGHGGGFPGINSNLEVYLDTGYTTVVMSN